MAGAFINQHRMPLPEFVMHRENLLFQRPYIGIVNKAFGKAPLNGNGAEIIRLIFYMKDLVHQDAVFVDIFVLVADIMLAYRLAVSGIEASLLQKLHQSQADGCLAAVPQRRSYEEGFHRFSLCLCFRFITVYSLPGEKGLKNCYSDGNFTRLISSRLRIRRPNGTSPQRTIRAMAVTPTAVLYS